MKKLKIKAYKIVVFKNETLFEIKTSDKSPGTGTSCIEALASVVKTMIKLFFQENDEHPLAQVSIDFTPFHEIEITKPLSPRHCFPLTKEERNEFWKYYNSIS